MYATCLFCKKKLGRNDAIEHFPVGRRLAYDAAKGRLWVVCRWCERWNLTPLEARWEAIEEAERWFPRARRRIGTGNISLARLNEGLELVRIGAPPRLELAHWRYGDQYGRRRTRHLFFSAWGGMALVSPFVGLAWMPAIGVVAGVNLTYLAADAWRRFQDTRTPRVFVHDDVGFRLGLTAQDIRTAALVRLPEVRDWCLTVQQPASSGDGDLTAVTLRGGEAMNALASMLPYLNGAGGSSRQIREALDVLDTSGNLHALVYSAAESVLDGPMRAGKAIRKLRGPSRLALEMALHQEDERRATEGELSALEQRWREAEEIASIADALLVPSTVVARLEELREARRAGDRTSLR